MAARACKSGNVVLPALRDVLPRDPIGRQTVTPTMHVALYAEVDPNLVEGPAVWLAETTRLMSRLGWRVTVLLRRPRTRDEVLSILDPLPGVTVVEPNAPPAWLRRDLSPRMAVRRIERIDTLDRFDAVLVRGRRTARAALLSPRLAPRLACYVTDLPGPSARLGDFQRRRLSCRLARAPLLLWQTPEMAAEMSRQLANSGRAKNALLPPIVADEAFAIAHARPPAEGETLRLVYAGKFARAWNTVEMTELPGSLARIGIAAELHVAGNKFVAAGERRFPADMRCALERPGVVWHGGLPRVEALELAAAAHIGLSWRSPSLDDSLELSTKLLDYGALGLPVLCNPTPMHRRLLGEDYPLFATTAEEALTALRRCARDRHRWQSASAAVARLAEGHRSGPIGAALEAAFADAFPPPSQPGSKDGAGRR
jgi:hypothetical protein